MSILIKDFLLKNRVNVCYFRIMSLGNQNVAEFDAETSESSENKDLKIQTNPSYSQTVSALFKKKVVYTKKNISTIFTMVIMRNVTRSPVFYLNIFLVSAAKFSSTFVFLQCPFGASIHAFDFPITLSVLRSIGVL